MELCPHAGGSRHRTGNRGLMWLDIRISLGRLPSARSEDALWYAMPLTELVTAVYVAASMKKYTGSLPECVPAPDGFPPGVFYSTFY